MQKITIKVPITVNAVVTDSLKAQLAAELQEAIKKTDMELQQLEFHGKRIMAEQLKVDPSGMTALRQQIDAEKKQRLDLKTHMLERVKETALLENGAVVPQGNMERMVEIGVGDNLSEIMAQSILVEDGKIIEIKTAV